jgi:23S rRNA G2445 N2-methylase RlmL
MATCVPGLEFVLAAEINEKFPNANNMAEIRGKVVFDMLSEPADYGVLKCADNLYKLYRVFSAGVHKSDLPCIGKNISSIDFEAGESSAKKIIVSVSRTGKHTYSRFDAENQITQSLLSAGNFAQGTAENHNFALRVDITDEICSVYKQLTLAETRFRGTFFQSVPGGIRHSAAHCLVRLSFPQNTDIFYDPFCGAGTIPFERSFYKGKKIFASDYDTGVLEKARANLGQSAIIFEADAANTKMKECGVSKVVTNMPWGKQVKVSALEQLYSDFMRELKRILAPNGIAVILTDQTENIKNSCNVHGLSCRSLAKLSLHGLHPEVFEVKD